MTALPPPDGSPGTEPVLEPPAPTATGPTAADSRSQQIVGMSFDKETRAEEVLLNLAHLQQEGQITLADAVVLRKDHNGKAHVRQTVDPSPKTGALSGSMWGLLIGTLFAGPIGFLVGAAAGAGGGALAAKLIDVGLNDNWVKQVGEWLDPGTSALLILVADEVHPVVLRELERFEGTVLYCTFPEAVRHELERALATSPHKPSIGEPGEGATFDTAPAPDASS
jgi:uncharacterized membrane protein